MQKSYNLTKIICEIGIFSAIGYILDEFQSIFFKGVFVNGGSIGFAMIVVLIIGYRRGFLSALLTGLLMGLFDLATGAFIIHPAQLLLDYLFSYAVVAIGVLFKPVFDRSIRHKVLFLMLGTIIGGLTKFACHFTSGVVFWGDPSTFAWGLTNFSPFLYSFVYNIAFIGPTIIISSLLLFLIYKKGRRILVVEHYYTKPKVYEEAGKRDFGASIITSLTGIVIFVYFLIDYIRSFAQETSGGTISYSFSKDSMVIFILGLFVLICGVICLVKNIKKQSAIDFNIGGIIFSISLFTLYSFTSLIKTATKGGNYTQYLIWFLVAFVLLAISIFGLIKIKRKKS